MSNSDDTAQEADLSESLNGETAIIAWSELVRHFARGVVIHVTAELDLVETAASVARDDTSAVQSWLESGLMRRASDDDARDWTEREPDFWCVVTAPWVLVQEKQPEAADSTPRVVH
ncbi:DUF2288 domain-containing protein [Granulosicoccus sp. 3-233]|uniref:DUF2288 domain-containing protein n=1 Tax=Granulosicoccus sp. 3-233 TaxID=3417969 RepID=UPI003D356D7B